MRLTDQQLNAAIMAIVREIEPSSGHFSDAEMISMGQATWYWFAQVLSGYENIPSADNIREDETYIKNIAIKYLINAIKHINPIAKNHTDEAIRETISDEEVIEQTALFTRLACIGLDAIHAADELVLMIENFNLLDIDKELEDLTNEEN